MSISLFFPHIYAMRKKQTISKLALACQGLIWSESSDNQMDQKNFGLFLEFFWELFVFVWDIPLFKSIPAQSDTPELK